MNDLGTRPNMRKERFSLFYKENQRISNVRRIAGVSKKRSNSWHHCDIRQFGVGDKMKLFIGGAFQGKTQAALDMTGLREIDIIDGESCSLQEIRNARGLFILDRFHELVRRALNDETKQADQTKQPDQPDQAVSLAGLEQLVTDGTLGRESLAIVCNELGCGVVPLEQADRTWREKTGRLLCELAKQASEVYRVTAGIAVRIK